MFRHGEFHHRLIFEVFPGVVLFRILFSEWNQPICLQFACAVFAYIVWSLAPAAHTLPSVFQSAAVTLNSSVTWLFGFFLLPNSTGYQLHRLYSEEHGVFSTCAAGRPLAQITPILAPVCLVPIMLYKYIHYSTLF